MIKPIIYISKCITFSPVRFNSQIISNDFVEKLKKFIEPITHCPEVEIGLSVPRMPLRLVYNKNTKDIRLVQTETEKDFTDDMIKYAQDILANITEIDGFILKSKSPSCGIKDVKVYPSINPKTIFLNKKGKGIFGESVIKNFSNKVIIEDEGRLNDIFIRDNFLKSIFLSAQFRKIKKENKIYSLIRFHEKNKLLIMSYDQKILKQLGRLVANIKKVGCNEGLKIYEELLREILSKPYKKSNLINSLEHSFGYFKSYLTSEEKKYFLYNLKKFADGKIGPSNVIVLLKSYIIRFNENYLKEQTLFNPYPEELNF